MDFFVKHGARIVLTKCKTKKQKVFSTGCLYFLGYIHLKFFLQCIIIHILVYIHDYLSEVIFFTVNIKNTIDMI